MYDCHSSNYYVRKFYFQGALDFNSFINDLIYQEHYFTILYKIYYILQFFRRTCLPAQQFHFCNDRYKTTILIQAISKEIKRILRQ